MQIAMLPARREQPKADVVARSTLAELRKESALEIARRRTEKTQARIIKVMREAAGEWLAPRDIIAALGCSDSGGIRKQFASLVSAGKLQRRNMTGHQYLLALPRKEKYREKVERLEAENERLRTTLQQVLTDAQAQDVLVEWWPMMERALIGSNDKAQGRGAASSRQDASTDGLCSNVTTEKRP
jgi:Fic family protein